MRPATDNLGYYITGKISEQNVSYGPENCSGHVPDKERSLVHLGCPGDKGNKGAGCSEESAPEDTFSAIGSKKILTLSNVLLFNDISFFNKFPAEASEQITGIVADNCPYRGEDNNVIDFKVALSRKKTG